MPESVESSKFVLQRARMFVECDWSKVYISTKFELRPQIFVKLSFKELHGSMLYGLHLFDNEAIIHWVKHSWKTEKAIMWVHETPILEVIFVTFIFIVRLSHFCVFRYPQALLKFLVPSDGDF